MERDRLQVKHFKGWQIPPITWHFNYLTAWCSRMIHLWVWAPWAPRTYVCAWVWVTTVMASCFVTLGAAAHQSPLSMAFSGQEHWRGLPYPPPGDLPNPGTKPASHVSCTRRLVFTPGTTGKVLHPYNTFFHTFFGCILFDQLFILQLSSAIIF